MTDTPTTPPEADRTEPIDLNAEMQRSYIEYAMSVIVSRALPDVRDGLKPVHRRIRVPDRMTQVAEHGGGGRFPHADAAGQAQPVTHARHPQARTAARRSSSTAGRMPNQRSNPGAAWCSSMPSPSTAASPRRRAAARRSVSRGA